MRHLTTVSSDELIDSLHIRVISSTICSAMLSMISWQVKIFLSLFITFRTNIRMSIIYLSPCSILFALNLDWSVNISVDKKIKFSFYICELVFHFSLWLKLSICFSLVLFSLEMHSRSGKKLTEKKIKSRSTVLQTCTLCNLIAGGGGAVPILRKNCHPFPPFPFINTSSQMKIFYIPRTPFYYNLRPCPPTVLLINNIYFWKSKLKHTGVDITCFLLTKSSLTKLKKYLLEAPYKTNETSKLEFFTKKVNGL